MIIVVPLARLDHLGDVQLRGVELDEVHELLRLVLGVEDGQLRIQADVRALTVEAAVQQAHQRVEGALLLVLRDQLLEVVRVHDDVHARELGAAVLLRLDARNVHLLPGPRVVGLLRRVDGRGVLLQLHVAGGELRVVRDGGVEDLRRLVGALLVEAVADLLQIIIKIIMIIIMINMMMMIILIMILVLNMITILIII